MKRAADTYRHMGLCGLLQPNEINSDEIVDSKGILCTIRTLIHISHGFSVEGMLTAPPQNSLVVNFIINVDCYHQKQLYRFKYVHLSLLQ